jgi:Phage P22-like portal protein
VAEYDESAGARITRIIQGAKDCVQRVEDAESDNRAEARKDLRYKAGEQWPETISTAREAEDRPCLVLNKIFVKQTQIANDYELNRPQIEVHPASADSDPQVATILDGLVRYIAYGSQGQHADVLAMTSAADIGWGYVRLRTEYVSDTSFDQQIVLDGFDDTLRVYFDSQSTSFDGSDATECVILTHMRRDEFARRWPDAEANATSYLADKTTSAGWLSEDDICVGEYYCCEYVPDRLLELRNGRGLLESQLQDPQLAQLAMQVGFTNRQRSLHRKAIKWYHLTAVDLLEERDIPGQYIPVVPFYGNWVVLDGERKRFGSIRFLRDPQQILNYAETTNVELVGLQPRAPWVGPEGFMAGHENEWRNSNNSNLVALEYAREGLDGQPILEPPQRQPFPAPPLALVEMKEAANRYIDEISGIGQPVQLTPGSPRSQVSIREQDSQASMATAHYFARAKLAMLQVHKIMLAWIPVYHTAPQMVQILGVDGRQDMQPINQQAADRIVNDVTVGQYGVRLASGPSYQTQRQEGQDKLVAVGAAYPDLWAKAGSDIIRTFNIPGGERIAQKLAMGEPMLPDPQGDPRVAVAQLTQQLQKIQQEAQALNAVAEQLEQQAKDLTEQNRELRLGIATVQAQRQGDQAEAGLRQRQDALKIEEEQWSATQKELQLSAQIARLQAQLATQQHKTAVAQNGASSDD